MPYLVCCTQSLCPCGRPLLTHTPQETLKHSKGMSSSVSVESPGELKVLFEPSEHPWQVWGLILNTVCPLLLSCWGFSFALGCGVYFFGGIQHSPVNDWSAVSCNFGVLIGEEEHTTFYISIVVISLLFYFSSLVIVLFIKILKFSGHTQYLCIVSLSCLSSLTTLSRSFFTVLNSVGYSSFSCLYCCLPPALSPFKSPFNLHFSDSK